MDDDDRVGTTVVDGEDSSRADRRTADAFIERIAARIYDPINTIDPAVVDALGDVDDNRSAWLVADALRFVGRGPEFEALVAAGSELGGLTLRPETAWLDLNNHLLAEDRPAPPGYRDHKRELFVAIDATWAPFFEDDNADVDWRFVTFGGVLADRRPFGSEETCQCIAALDDPLALPAAGVPWLDDRDVVIGVTFGGESRAYPRHIMETHELVNDRLGGERIVLAYCTLCGAGQVYLVDRVPERFQPVVMRTSGLLHRSNKIMFDLASRSMVDAFGGFARTGPWREAGVVLEQVATVTSEWGAWREAHPDTTVMAGVNGAGADYPLDPLGGRDDGGPIFPIGDVDPRLFPQTDVIGVTVSDGSTVAFPLVEVRNALRRGETVAAGGVTVTLDGTGLRAIAEDGTPLVSHQAYWFAWSQFNPDTDLWSPG
ncbi:MAG: DUF3179 domain-containing (seleno)protein [Actinomycetota bacterium]